MRRFADTGGRTGWLGALVLAAIAALAGGLAGCDRSSPAEPDAAALDANAPDAEPVPDAAPDAWLAACQNLVSGTELGCDDDGGMLGHASSLTVSGLPSGIYYIIVDSYARASVGDFVLTVTETP